MESPKNPPVDLDECSRAYGAGSDLEEYAHDHRLIAEHTLSRVSLDSAISTRTLDSDEETLPLDLRRGETDPQIKVRIPEDNRNDQNPHGHNSRRHGLHEKRDTDGKDATNTDHFRNNGHGSDFSSISTSEDMELRRLELDGMVSDEEENGLTEPDWRHWKRRRKRNEDLDSRIGGRSHASTDSQKAAERSVIKALLLNSLLIASWYLFSLSISIYNKWMFAPKYLNFHFPLFTTSLHMVVQFCLAALVLYFVPRLRPRSTGVPDPLKNSPSQQDASPSDKPLMTRMFYLTRICPCGVATGLDIGLGNMSLKLISLTFYTMCKSSSLAFVLAFAFLFRLETLSVKLIAIIATMTVGVIMMVAGEVDFDILGFILVILAAFFSGFRWSLTQILLLRSPATSNPFSSILFLAPVMFLSLAIVALPVEGVIEVGKGLRTLVETKGVFLGICILLFPGMLAFLMTASEFALLQRTSVVTLSICGIFKEVMTISAAGIVFHDPLTPINVSGLLVTMVSIGAYNYIKITKMRKDAHNGVQEQQDESADDIGEAAESLLATRRPREGSTNIQPEDRSRDSSQTSVVKLSRGFE